MATGLNVSDVVNVTINLSPKAAGYRNFGALLIAGSSDVIDTNQRIRQYSDIDGIANDFGTTAPEYLAAAEFFSQVPKPNIGYVGRFVQTASVGLLRSAVLTPAQRLLSNFTAITAGSFHISIDGTAHDTTGLNFSAATNLNGVAADIQAALDTVWPGVTVTWDANNNQFTIRSATTGPTSSVSYLSAAASGTDISGLLGMRTGVAPVPVNGLAAETPLAFAQLMADKSSQWYGLTFATATPIAISDAVAVASYIEASSQSRIFGSTISTTDVLDPTNSNDLASQLKTLGYKRSFTQYSSSSPYAAVSLFGRAFTVDFNANKSTITLKFKQEPGVAAELLTETQAATLAAKNCNVFVAYNNDTAIIQEGVMANGYFFDEVHGTDWLQNRVQTDVWNLLYQSKTKIPQTDPGTHLIVTRIESSMDASVNNGLVAPGQWNADGFGQLAQGDTLTKGYYIYAPLVATQSQADREARKAVPIQVAAKLAGAVHFVGVAIDVNR
ncbi:DUF3383 domain-containing protein [Labrys neptuniae]